ncbi:hypothetical protein ACOSP7_007387 [Xanthoceras sorbifolium]
MEKNRNGHGSSGRRFGSSNYSSGFNRNGGSQRKSDDSYRLGVSKDNNIYVVLEPKISGNRARKFIKKKIGFFDSYIVEAEGFAGIYGCCRIVIKSAIKLLLALSRLSLLLLKKIQAAGC